MATVLLASGTTAAQSSTVVLADGASATLIMVGNGTIQIQISSASGYVTAGYLDSQYPVKNIAGPGTYRVSRELTTVAVGVDRE